MADLKETTAAGIKVARAAVSATDVIRKGEHDSAVSARPTASVVNAAILAAAHDALTVQQSESLMLTLADQELIGSVRVAPDDSALMIDPDGLRVDLGTDYSQAARGSHTHANDHPAATGQTTGSIALTVGAGQVLSAAAVLNPSGNLEVSSGLRVVPGAYATAIHSHTNATVSAAGFMSAADKARLDGLTTANTFEDTVTVEWSPIGSSAYEADVRYSVGLTTDVNGLKVDLNEVATRSHTHAAVTGSSDGMMTEALYDKLAVATFVYRGFADELVPPVGSSGEPVGFDLVLDDDKVWEAIRITGAPIANPVSADFAGLWQLRMDRRPNTTIGSSNGTLAQTTVLANQLREAMLALRLLP